MDHRTEGNNEASLRAEVTELQQRLAEMQSGEIQAKLAAIVESSDDAIVSKTLTGIIQTWNGGAERIFGYTAAEAIGKSILMLIPPDRQDEEPQILERLQRGDRIDHYETVRMTKSGRQINVSVTISPLRDQRGVIVGASKIARDITLQREIQRELQEAKEAAEAANLAKDHFLSVLSHELRTPLTPVLAEMSFLESRPDLPPELHSHIAMVRRNVETEARLVDDLLDLTRISKGKIELRNESINIHDIIHGVVRMISAQIEAKSIALTVALRAKRHMVWGDPGRLQQILLNLLTNAVKFTPDEGEIHVRTANLGATLEVEVADTGLGLEPEVMGNLFKPFSQGSRGRRYGGLGLGLSISRGLAEMHGGTLTATSEGVDRGSTFRLTLTTREAIGEKTHAAPRTPPATEAGRHVLLIEDHADTRVVMERLLRSMGWQVTSAGTVSEAVLTAEKVDFDLIISDIGLPDGTGLEAMEHIRRRRPVPAIALSGYGHDQDVTRSRSAGFVAHLTKPVNFGTLRETIEQVMSMKKS